MGQGLAHGAQRRALDAAAELADVLLRAAPGLRVLASSREPLDVPGEQCYPIRPLPLPARGDGLAALAQSPAVQLFVARAQSHRPDFSLDAERAAPVAERVVRLEGIPRAIELAAARLRTMEVQDINEGLSRRYEVLTGGSRRLQARQQTLRALVDWSYDLLQPAEQAALQRLAVCAGGFDLAAAQAVCGDVAPDDAARRPSHCRSAPVADNCSCIPCLPVFRDPCGPCRVGNNSSVRCRRQRAGRRPPCSGGTRLREQWTQEGHEDVMHENDPLWKLRHALVGVGLALLLSVFIAAFAGAFLGDLIVGDSYGARVGFYSVLLLYVVVGAGVLFAKVARHETRPVSLGRLALWVASLWLWPGLWWVARGRGAPADGGR